MPLPRTLSAARLLGHLDPMLEEAAQHGHDLPLLLPDRAVDLGHEFAFFQYDGQRRGPIDSEPADDLRGVQAVGRLAAGPAYGMRRLALLWLDPRFARPGVGEALEQRFLGRCDPAVGRGNHGQEAELI